MNGNTLTNYDTTFVTTFVEGSPTLTCFVNPFTGKAEEYRSERDANAKMLASAAQRINDLQAEIDKIKAFLVL